MERLVYIPLFSEILFAIWCIVLGFGIYKHVINIKTGEIKEKDNIILAYFLFMYLVSLFIIYYFNYIQFGYFINVYLGYIGYAIQVLAILLAVWSLISYGKYWTFNLTVFKDHKIITTGPSAVVRHPFYLSNFLFLLGYSLSLRTILSLLGAFITLGFLVYIIEIEEKFNIEKLGDKYKEYMKKVKYKIIPFIY